MDLKIYLNKCYKNTSNMITIKLKCKYFNLLSNNNTKILIVDNLGVYSNSINSIDFIVNGYKSTVTINNHNVLIGTNTEYTEELKAKNAEELNNIILNIK